ncbi:MAG: HEPN domain-containing protein [Sedimentisphaerales bacterium]|nr:HEPN domain-containing protein [Sedimentisphaerales bacterium]
MTAHNPETIEKVKKWLSYANDDLRSARHLMTLADCPYSLVAYHAQQCAEKALKGYLICKEIDIPYTHNISRLLDLCNPSTGWLDVLRDAETLTNYATAARYPAEEEPVSNEDALEAIEFAAKVQQTVRDELEKCGIKT